MSKQGNGTLVMRNRCSITGSTGYVKDYHGYTFDGDVVSKVLASLDSGTDVHDLDLDAKGVKFASGSVYRSKLKNEDGMLVFYAFKPKFHIFLR